MKIFPFLILALHFLVAIHSLAATESFYLTAKGAGLRSGMSLTNAFSPAELNNPANWSIEDKQDRLIGPNDDVLLHDDDGPIKSTLLVQQSGLSGKYISIKAGKGERPVISNASKFGIHIKSKSYILVEHISFRDTDDENIRISGNSHDILVNTCIFENRADSNEAIMIFPDKDNIYNVEIRASVFQNMPNVEAIRVSHWANTIHNIKVQQNIFKNVGVAFFIWGDKTSVTTNDSSPFNILFEENIIEDTTSYAVDFSSGIKNTGSSAIRGNFFSDIGEPISPNINALQLNWCRGLLVQNNIINTVQTSKPDGHGIIIDFAWTDNNYLCDSVVIRGNIISGCNAGKSSAAIVVYKGKNCEISNNICYNNSSGIKLSSPEAKDAVFYRNTAFNNTTANIFIWDSAPASVWTMNILHSAPYGILVARSSTEPTEFNNCFSKHKFFNAYNETQRLTMKLHRSDVEVDQKLYYEIKSICGHLGAKISTDNLKMPAGFRVFPSIGLD
jgi:hypothetical protein